MDITPESIRTQLQKDSARGAYRRLRMDGKYANLEPKEWFLNYDMMYASAKLGISAVYINTSGNHWKTLLDMKKVSQGYSILEYDPLQGVRTSVLSESELKKASLVLSPDLEDDYSEKVGNYGNENRLIDYINEFFHNNPTPQSFVEVLKNIGRMQANSYDCGPYAIIVAHERQKAVNSNTMEIEELPTEEDMEIEEVPEMDIKEVPEKNRIRSYLERRFRR